jgi:putative addiction module component (TIGR02574 family)
LSKSAQKPSFFAYLEFTAKNEFVNNSGFVIKFLRKEIDMGILTEEIYEQALDLPIDDRLHLIDKLLISTNLPTQADIDQAWSEEVERRSQELDSGTAKLIPGEEVFEKIKKRFSK